MSNPVRTARRLKAASVALAVTTVASPAAGLGYVLISDHPNPWIYLPAIIIGVTCGWLSVPVRARYEFVKGDAEAAACGAATSLADRVAAALEEAAEEATR